MPLCARACACLTKWNDATHFVTMHHTFQILMSLFYPRKSQAALKSFHLFQDCLTVQERVLLLIYDLINSSWLTFKRNDPWCFSVIYMKVLAAFFTVALLKASRNLLCSHYFPGKVKISMIFKYLNIFAHLCVKCTIFENRFSLISVLYMCSNCSNSWSINYFEREAFFFFF